ncbi:MAG: hypothetical protein ACRD50_01415 [Candidatus Acidiferrales bacterium]
MKQASKIMLVALSFGLLAVVWLSLSRTAVRAQDTPAAPITITVGNEKIFVDVLGGSALTVTSHDGTVATATAIPKGTVITAVSALGVIGADGVFDIVLTDASTGNISIPMLQLSYNADSFGKLGSTINLACPVVLPSDAVPVVSVTNPHISIFPTNLTDPARVEFHTLESATDIRPNKLDERCASLRFPAPITVSQAAIFTGVLGGTALTVTDSTGAMSTALAIPKGTVITGVTALGDFSNNGTLDLTLVDATGNLIVPLNEFSFNADGTGRLGSTVNLPCPVLLTSDAVLMVSATVPHLTFPIPSSNPGLYEASVFVPTGVQGGVPVVLRVGACASNSVELKVQ